MLPWEEKKKRLVTKIDDLSVQSQKGNSVLKCMGKCPSGSKQTMYVMSHLLYDNPHSLLFTTPSNLLTDQMTSNSNRMSQISIVQMQCLPGHPLYIKAIP